MMNCLHAQFSDRGILVDDSSEPHLFLAFADDCTGIMKNIDDADGCLQLVNDFSNATGICRNLRKTFVMPFSHRLSRSKLASLRATSPYKVLGVTNTEKLLGFLQGATITADARFCRILLKLRACYAIMKYRARTLREKVMLFQSIILPLLWYTASSTWCTA